MLSDTEAGIVESKQGSDGIQQDSDGIDRRRAEPVVHAAAHVPKHKQFQSLNFEKTMSKLWALKGASKKHVRIPGKTGHDGKPLTKPVAEGRGANRILVTCLIGILTGLTSFAISKSVAKLTNYRYWAIHEIFGHGDTFGKVTAAVVSFVGWNLTLAIASSLMVVYYAPGAKGSGIPEIKAYLNGINVPHFLRLRTFFVTVASTIGAVSSGLAIGPEGPLVHIGAIYASAFTYGRKKINIFGKSFDLNYKFLKEFNTDSSRRDFITAGAGAGFAAAFGAPIGGVLFAMEETATHFPHKLLWRCLMATTLACFTLLFSTKGVLSANVGSYGVLSFGNFSADALHVWELPCFILLGVGGGLLGALFNQNAHHFFHLRPKQPRNQVLEVAAMSVITSAITLLLVKYAGTCIPVDKLTPGGPENIGEPFCNANYTSPDFDFYDEDSCKQLYKGQCPPGQFDDMALLWLSNREEALKAVIQAPRGFSIYTLVVMSVVFFALQSATFGVSITAGIFMPTIMVGACFGGSCGLLADFIVTNVFKSTQVTVGPWALMGAAALLGGDPTHRHLSLCDHPRRDRPNPAPPPRDPRGWDCHVHRG